MACGYVRIGSGSGPAPLGVEEKEVMDVGSTKAALPLWHLDSTALRILSTAYPVLSNSRSIRSMAARNVGSSLMRRSTT